MKIERLNHTAIICPDYEKVKNIEATKEYFVSRNISTKPIRIDKITG